MPAQDTTQIKEKIISFLRIRGPSLPVHIAKETQMSMLFASAFLSELLSEKKIKLSHMRVGSSPLYLISGQENRLENFSNFLNSKEKESFALLKEKKFLKDSEQEPAIRVALRSIRDFAIPFKYQDEIYWRFFTIPEEEFLKGIKIIQPLTQSLHEKEVIKVPEEKEVIKPAIALPEKEVIRLSQEIQKSIPEKEIIKASQELEIFDKPHKKAGKKKPKTKKTKKDDKFFNKVKEFLSKESIEIVNIESFNNNEISLLVKINGEENLLVAYNKKKITEYEILKAHKKAQELNLKFTVIGLGGLPKKIENLISALKDLSDIKKMEE